MNPFEQSTQQLLRFLTSHAEREVIDYIRQEMQHDAPDSIPTEEELFAFFQSPDKPTKLDAYQQMLATDRLLEYAEISLRTLCDLIRYQQLKELGMERGEQAPPSVLLASTRLLYHMGNIFRDNAPAPAANGVQIDRKRLAQLRQKRVALGHKPDDHELEQQGFSMKFHM